MTIADLIAELQALPQDMVATMTYFDGNQWVLRDITDVRTTDDIGVSVDTKTVADALVQIVTGAKLLQIDAPPAPVWHAVIAAD